MYLQRIDSHLLFLSCAAMDLGAITAFIYGFSDREKVLDIFEEEQIIEHVQKVSSYLEEKLDALVEDSELVEARRGKGLMQGLVLKKPVGEVVQKAMEQGLVVISASGNVLRLVPPLTIEENHVDEMIKKLQQAFLELK